MLLMLSIMRSRCGGNLTANELHYLSVRAFEVQISPDSESPELP